MRKHINPVLGPVAPPDVQPEHIDRVLMRIVASGAPTVANDALRYMSRMFRRAVRNHWIDRNPAADIDRVDAGGDEVSRDRRLATQALQQLSTAMRTTPNFGRENELSVLLLLALCVRKMELLSAGHAQPSKYVLFTPLEDTPINELISAAQQRWRIEGDYQDLNQDFGLGHYEGRGMATVPPPCQSEHRNLRVPDRPATHCRQASRRRKTSSNATYLLFPRATSRAPVLRAQRHVEHSITTLGLSLT